MTRSNPAPIHKHEVLKRLDPSGAGVQSELGSGGTGSWVLSPCAPGAIVEGGDGLGASGAKVGLLVASSVGVGDKVGAVLVAVATVGVTAIVAVAVVTVGVLALVEVAVATVSVGWSVDTGEGEPEGTGTGVSEGLPGGLVGVLVGGSAVGLAVDGVVGTPDGVSVGMVWFR